MLDRRRLTVVAAIAMLVGTGAAAPGGAAASVAERDNGPLPPTATVLNHPDKDLQHVAAIAADDVWEVGILDASQALMRHWDGRRWQSFATPGGLRNLYAVEGRSSSDVWVGGQGGIIHWDGSAWTPPWPASDETIVRSIVAISADDVWAVGGYDVGFTAFTMHWDGSAWTQIGKLQRETALISVDADRADDVWTVGYGGVVERWDGKSWKRMPDQGIDASDVAVLAPDDVWMSGSVDGSRPPWEEAAMWHRDGQDIVQVDVPQPGRTSGLGGMSVVSPPTDIWAVGGRISKLKGEDSLIVHWDGHDWQLIPAPHIGHPNGLADVSVVTANDAYAIGTFKQYRFAGSMLNLHWDGASWSELAS